MMHRFFRLVVLSAGLFAAMNPAWSQDDTPPLPPVSDIFTVAVQARSGNRFDPEYQFDEKSFLEVYPSLVPARVEIPLGWDAVWQNGVIVTKDKKVLFWRTCDKRFIMVDTPGTWTYGTAVRISLADRWQKP